MRGKRTQFTTGSGRVPGSGEHHHRESVRPDDARFVARRELADLVGVSNPVVIGIVLHRLGIEPEWTGASTRSTYKNGGSGQRVFDVPYYDRSAVDRIRRELEAVSIARGEGRLSYEGTTFSWRTPYDRAAANPE